MEQTYPSWLLRRVPRPLAGLGLLLATAGAADAQTTSFAPAATYSTSDSSYPASIAVADVNGDGKLDLLTANTGSSTVGVLLGTGTGTFQPVATFSTGTTSMPTTIAVADVNGDGKPDLLTANYSNGSAGVLLGTGNGSFQPVTIYGLSGSSKGIAVADVNNDNKLDLLIASDDAGVLLGTGIGTFQPITTFSTGTDSLPRGIAVADVNGDGELDLLTANTGSSNAGVLLGNGNGTFQPIATFSTGPDSFPRGIAVADVNGDGKLDLLTANHGSDTTGVLLGNGNGTFQPVTTYGTGTKSQPTTIAVADVNGDGKPDLLTANYNTHSTGTAGVLLGTGIGTFQPIAIFSMGPGNNPTSIAVADVNGDGKLDLLMANNSSSTAGVLLNTTVYAPTLTTINPPSAPVGTRMTLTGNNLSSAMAVSFHGTTATTFAVVNSTTLTATVPTGATSGNLTVTTPGGTSGGIAFTVTRGVQRQQQQRGAHHRQH